MNTIFSYFYCLDVVNKTLHSHDFQLKKMTRSVERYAPDLIKKLNEMERETDEYYKTARNCRNVVCQASCPAKCKIVGHGHPQRDILYIFEEFRTIKILEFLLSLIRDFGDISKPSPTRNMEGRPHV